MSEVIPSKGGVPVRTFIIAEAGVNHDGRPERALALIDAAAEAGADAVKFQTFEAAEVATRSAPKADYQSLRTDPDESQLDMLKKFELTDEVYHQLLKRCAERGIEFLSTPFDVASIARLERFGVRAFKLASGELTNLIMLRELARVGKPVYMSTGMATLEEVRDGARILTEAGVRTTLLHCTSAYPTASDQVNLRAIKTMADALDLPVGYSDHTTSLHIAAAAVALGAVVIEKHITLDKTLPGPDHAASLEPSDFALMVRGIREVELALGDGVKVPMPSEMSTRAVVRRSLVASESLVAGRRLEVRDLHAKRPGTGISPMELDRIVGQTLRRPLKKDQILDLSDLSEPL
ncbi:MAG: N-acetylneuraminate synthase [Gemmatimonadaceae bacterium]